ncbi:MAG TPA: hypothetical protein VIG80_09465 [Bacillaceae bacterium]
MSECIRSLQRIPFTQVHTHIGIITQFHIRQAVLSITAILITLCSNGTALTAQEDCSINHLLL